MTPGFGDHGSHFLLWKGEIVFPEFALLLGIAAVVLAAIAMFRKTCGDATALLSTACACASLTFVVAALVQMVFSGDMSGLIDTSQQLLACCIVLDVLVVGLLLAAFVRRVRP